MESKNKKQPQKKNKNPKRIKTGIYIRGDLLYIRYPDSSRPGKTIEDATGLTYNKQNVILAEEMRFKRIGVDKVDSLNSNSTVSEVADYFLRKKQREVVGSTFNGYFYRMRRVKGYFRDMPIRKVKESDIEEFYDGLLLGSLDKEVAKKPLDADTVKDTKRTFGAAFQMAVDAGIASKNLARIVKLNKEILADLSEDEDLDDDFFDEKDTERFFRICKNHPQYRLFYLTFFYCLRRSEVLGLRWKNIDFEKGLITINHTVTKGFKGETKRRNHTKTPTSNRKLGLVDCTIAILREIKEEQSINRLRYPDSYYESDYVFTKQDGSLYQPDSLTQAFHRIIRDNPDLPQGITFHGLRASGITRLILKGANPKSVQVWAGHKDIETTLKYYTKVKGSDNAETMANQMAEGLNI